MSFFNRTKKVGGWVALSMQGERVFLAHVRRDQSDKPVVEFVASYGAEASSLATLEKISRELQLGQYVCSHMLGAGEYQLLAVEAPNVPADELKVAIRWRLKDMLDFHVDDATIDVLDIPVDKNAPTRNHSMYAVAARNQLIQQRQTLFNEAKIPLAVIDIPEMAQRNIAALLEPEGRGLALLSFDDEGGLLTVTFNGELYLSRRVDVPFSQLIGSETEQRTAAFERITLEVQRSLDHFDRQYHFITLAKLVLSPLADGAAALREYLAANLYIPIESLDFDSVLDLSRSASLKPIEVQQRYFLTIGAALRHEEKVL
jgi:MSHA biogenesis protein MshI